MPDVWPQESAIFLRTDSSNLMMAGGSSQACQMKEEQSHGIADLLISNCFIFFLEFQMRSSCRGSQVKTAFIKIHFYF